MQLDIEKLIYGGDGLSRLPADEHGRGKTVFVPFVLPGEKIEASIAEQRPGFARARMNRIVNASPYRVEPGCPYFGRCGGCQYQHIDYAAQLGYKAEILRETLRRTAKLELEVELQIHSAAPWNYRNRTRLRLQHAPQFALGYYLHASHELLPIEQCPISSLLINRAIAQVWVLGRSRRVPDTIHSLQFFANHDDTQLLVEVLARPGFDAKVTERFALDLQAALPEIVGATQFTVASSRDEGDDSYELGGVRAEPEQLAGAESLTYHAAGFDYRVSAGAFFQTNRFLVDELVQVAISGATGNLALDLYAGAGLFTAPLAKNFDQVMAVEIAPQSFDDLRHNAPPNVKATRATTENFLAERAAKLKPELVVVDPPRAGLGPKIATALGRMNTPRVTYVSCDPATLSRDLRVLLESGFRVQQAHLVDLFPQTFHMETCLHLER